MKQVISYGLMVNTASGELLVASRTFVNGAWLQLLSLATCHLPLASLFQVK